VNGFRASVAIVRRSLDRRLAGFACAFAIAAFAAERVSASMWLVILVIAEAPAATFDRRNDPRRRSSFFAMPLYGRQLARALAVAPCLDSLAVPLGILGGLTLAGRPLGPAASVTLIAAALAATLVALSARLRTGRNAMLYLTLAIASEAGIVAPLFLGQPNPLLSLILAALIAFTALRAFGETLARYDPLPKMRFYRTGGG
jgi:hypothetical protein